MKDYLNEINDRYPIRRKADEKKSFYEYICGEITNRSVKIEVLDQKHNNIIIGDPSKAEILFTAHYDTPAASLVPNMMIPANKLIGTVINLIYPLLMALFSLFVSVIITTIAGADQRWAAMIYMVLYFGLFYCTTRLLSNKHNKNDNTSGVAAVVSLANQVDDERVAFILFDNEEKGLLGSKAYYKANKCAMEDKIVINFDCIGNGDQIMFIAMKNAEKSASYSTLKSIAVSNENFGVHHLSARKSSSNSDYKSFPSGIGVMAAKRNCLIGFVTGRIHTHRDTVANTENIEFVVRMMAEFVKTI